MQLPSLARYDQFNNKELWAHTPFPRSAGLSLHPPAQGDGILPGLVTFGGLLLT